MSMKKNIFGMTVPELAEVFRSIGAEAYRAKQLAKWLYEDGVSDFGQMSNLPSVLREKLTANYTADMATVATAWTSADRRTDKYLLAFADGNAVETVLMRQPYGNSVCVSTQVGCAMGCIFCASTIGGLVRNLSAAEILTQIMHVKQVLRHERQKLTNIVIMGSGEPLSNYENVVEFIRLCHDEAVLGIGYRNITLSTAGIVPAMERLALEGLPITLAISLHAPNDELRTKIMPINRRYPLASVVKAGDFYAEKTGRRVTYEYTLIKGMNDQPIHAEQLSGLLRGCLANVNLIPLNPVKESGLARPDERTIKSFIDILRARRIESTVRREMGSDIAAACGQLRKSYRAGE